MLRLEPSQYTQQQQQQVLKIMKKRRRTKQWLTEHLSSLLLRYMHVHVLVLSLLVSVSMIHNVFCALVAT